MVLQLLLLTSLYVCIRNDNKSSWNWRTQIMHECKYYCWKECKLLLRFPHVGFEFNGAPTKTAYFLEKRLSSLVLQSTASFPYIYPIRAIYISIFKVHTLKHDRADDIQPGTWPRNPMLFIFVRITIQIAPSRSSGATTCNRESIFTANILGILRWSRILGTVVR